MAPHPSRSEYFTMVKPDGTVRRTTDLPTLMHRTWGPVGIVRAKCPPAVWSLGRSLNHAFTMKLAGRDVVTMHTAAGGLQTREAPTGALTILAAGVEYACETRHPCDILCVDVAPDFAEMVLGRLGRVPFTFGVVDALIAPVMTALAAEAESGSRNSAGRVEKLVTVLLSQTVERLGELPQPPPRPGALDPDRLACVREFVARHLDEGLGLDELSAVSGLSSFHFARTFKLATGLTPYRYLLHARVERAKTLLETTSLSITDIAFAAGFSTPSQFAATFRRLAGLPPSAYRARSN